MLSCVLSVVMLNAVVLDVVVLSVAAPVQASLSPHILKAAEELISSCWITVNSEKFSFHSFTVICKYKCYWYKLLKDFFNQ